MLEDERLIIEYSLSKCVGYVHYTMSAGYHQAQLILSCVVYSSRTGTTRLKLRMTGRVGHCVYQLNCCHVIALLVSFGLDETEVGCVSLN